MSAVALVTGAGGQVGRAVAASVPAGWSVRALAHAELDITDESAVARAVREIRPALVVHGAAYTSVDKAEAGCELAERVNAHGAGAVARQAHAAGARMIHLSTEMVFDGARGAPYATDDAPSPISAYGRSKANGERLVREGAPRALVLRTAWVYDSSGRNFVRAILARLRERDEVGVVADQIGTPTWAAGLAAAIWRAAALPDLSGVHHWTDAGIASWYDFAVAIREEALAAGVLERAGRVIPIRSEDYPLAAPRPACVVLDKSRSWPVLGTPPHWREQLRTMLRTEHVA